MADSILYSVANGVGVLQVNRPGRRNALNWEAQEQFAAAVQRAGRDPALRVLIITGSGDQAFVSGGDLKELVRHPDAASGARLNQVMGEALAALTRLPAPVIGAANGDAAGGGCEILTACDLRIAAPHARFKFVQIQNALTTGWGGAGRLVRLLGLSLASELLLTGRTLTAAEAQAAGFIHRLAPDNEPVLTVARAWAAELLQLPPAALAATKQLLQAAGDGSLADAYRLESDLFVRLWTEPDHLEAMRAFVEKRPPMFGRPAT